MDMFSQMPNMRPMYLSTELWRPKITKEVLEKEKPMKKTEMRHPENPESNQKCDVTLLR